MCVLAILDGGDSYGYDVAEVLSNKIELADGTVYPILRKLASDGLVTTYLQESKSGPPRKYYHITDDGKKRLEVDRGEWLDFSSQVNEILGG